MNLRARNKIKTGFNMSSMADIIFLLLIFFMITSTLVYPTALKLLLPKSPHQTSATPLITVSITRDHKVYVEDKRVSFNNLEQILQKRLGHNTDIYISLHVDENVPMKDVVKVMNIAKNNRYKLILATRPK